MYAFALKIMIRHFVEGNAQWMSLFFILHNSRIAGMGVLEEQTMRTVKVCVGDILTGFMRLVSF